MHPRSFYARLCGSGQQLTHPTPAGRVVEGRRIDTEPGEHVALQRLPDGSAMAVLDRADPGGRRHFARNLLALLIAAPAAHVAWRAWDEDLVGRLAAVQRTATGERRRLMLADGGVVHLNTATAIDIAYTTAMRELVLHGGEVLVDTAPDRLASPPRPFTVRSAHGRLRALGTRFVVRSEGGAAAGHTRLAVLEGAVEITPRRLQPSPLVVQAGQQVRFDAEKIGQVQPLDPHVADWSRGMLVADGLPLEDFIAELGRHRPGILRCDPEVAGLRITGAFQLDNSDAILGALPDTLPVRIVHRSRWWVSIVPAREG